MFSSSSPSLSLSGNTPIYITFGLGPRSWSLEPIFSVCSNPYIKINSHN